MNHNYNGFINEINKTNKTNNKICLLHQLILTKDLVKIKNNRSCTIKYILYNNNKLIDKYYQPYMIVRRKMCERLKLEYINFIDNNIYIL